MKARLFTILLVLLFCLPAALALQVTYDDAGNILSGPLDVVDLEQIIFGGDNQDRVVNVETSVTLKNIGNETINITDVEGALSSEFDFKVISGESAAIAPGSSHTFNLQVDIPLDFDALDDQGRENLNRVGQINFLGKKGSESLVVSSPIFIEAVNQLSLENLRVFINDRLEIVDIGENVDGVSPGDLIKVEIEIRNNFIQEDEDAEGEGTIRDVTIEDIDFELTIDHEEFDLDEDVNMGNIRAEQEEKEVLEFTIPNDLDSTALLVHLEVAGQDENGAEHTFIREFRIFIEQRRHELAFQDVKVLPGDKVSCGDELTFQFILANTGRQNEEDGRIVLMSEGLDLEKSENIALREGDTVEKTMKLTIPEDARPGTYIFSLKSYYNQKYQVNQKNIDIDVKDCESTGVAVGTPDSGDNTLPPPRVVTLTEVGEETSDNNTQLEEASDTSLLWVIAGVMLGLILILAVVIFLVWKFAY